MAMELERQREVGARLKELREPKPQPVIADEVGVTLRAYQAWEAGDSGIAWPNLQKLAKLFKVSENYLLYGSETPVGPESQLDRIEAKLDELLSRAPAVDPEEERLEIEAEEEERADRSERSDDEPEEETPGQEGIGP